jgi:hypothetical protein
LRSWLSRPFTDDFYFFSHAEFRTDSQPSSTAESGGTANVFAEGRGAADLSAGTLRAFAHTRTDPGHEGAGDVETWVGFGDSFRTVTAGGSPFDWSGVSATMSVDISGFQSSTGTSPYNAGAILMCVLPAGGLDAFATTIRENNYIEGDDDVDVCLSWQGYSLGPGDGDFPEVPIFPASVDFTFTPGGVADFWNTAHASYIGPVGTITRSASGIFPGTSLFDDPVPAPEPATAMLVSLGVGLIAARRRRLS